MQARPSCFSATAYLGERLLMQGRGFRSDVLRVANLRGSFVVVEDEMFCRREPGSDKFESFDRKAITYLNFLRGPRAYSNTLTVRKGEVCFSDLWTGCFDSGEASFTLENNAVCTNPNSVQQIIEYNGKTGDVLNFTYREFYGSRVAAPLTQNFTMDLNEGNVINYKGARLRIDGASNQEIQYAVLKNFVGQ